jgi:hypothetical protein
MMSKQRKNKIDRQVQEIVCRRCSGMQIDIMDIGEVFKAAYAADSGCLGQDVEAAVVEAYARLSQKVSA